MSSKTITAVAAHEFNIDKAKQLVEVKFRTDDGDLRFVVLNKTEALDALTTPQKTTLFAILDAWDAAAQAKDGFS